MQCTKQGNKQCLTCIGLEENFKQLCHSCGCVCACCARTCLPHSQPCLFFCCQCVQQAHGLKHCLAALAVQELCCFHSSAMLCKPLAVVVVLASCGERTQHRHNIRLLQQTVLVEHRSLQSLSDFANVPDIPHKSKVTQALRMIHFFKMF